jgi:suppressor for copper-sensitivity B
MRLLLALLLFVLPAQAFALSTDWVRDDSVSVRLITGVDGVGNQDTVPLGLEVTLAQGWHTYWRAPGEAGLPPQLDWTRSQTDENNLQNATLLYPAPERYAAYGLETVGYRDHVLFPVDAILRKAGQALNADMSADLLVCSSICVPKHFDLKLTVPTGTATASNEADILQQARSQLPTDGDKSGILLQGITTDGHSVTFAITSREILAQPDIFIENESINFGAPIVKIGDQGHKAELTVNSVDNLLAGTTLSGQHVMLTVTNGERAVEIKSTIPAPIALAIVAPVEKLRFGIALLFALIGGLILNLMPCVLPVLSLKILSIISHGGGSTQRVRQSFLITAAGILFSFLMLASVMVILQRFGLALGWGVQFQQPAFLILLVLLLTFFAANLWGLFEIPLPRFLADNADRFYHPKLAGDFVTGAFATLLATPCSAPFLGTAVGFALAGGPTEIFAIFTALGGGMSLPYLAVAVFPRVATLLPKPGIWMLRLRHWLGIALALTALWLLWVLAAQITALYAALIGVFMAGIVLLFALRKLRLRRSLIIAGIVELCGVALVLGFSGALIPKPAPEMDRQWATYSRNALDADIAEGKTVFLDITADWCLTCKANMKFTLSRDEVTQRLFHSDIVAMQADWTNPDPIITDLLHKYGRYGIPFNVVYGPSAPQGITLPELLTPALVLNSLDKASEPTSQH